MGGPIHSIASDGTGTKVAFSYGSDVAFVEQYAICKWSLILPTTTAKLTTTAVWMNPRNLPQPPSFPGLDETLPDPIACSLHFIEDGKSLMVSYVDHGIV